MGETDWTPMPHSETARQILRDHDCLTMEDAIARAIAAARREALEEAAKVAENHRCGEQLIRHKMSHVDQVGVVATTIAAAIRARIE